MCNIIVLAPGQMPVKSDLFNMCYNNWHGFGLVSVIDGKLSIVKEAPTEVDPNHVWSLLERDKDYVRYLHVRHNTVGATSLENTHPFDVLYSEKRQVVFMHNGTLYDYKPKTTPVTTWENGRSITTYPNTDNTGDSDTKIFTETILQKFAPMCGGDFTSEAMALIMTKFWPLNSNRGVIISNDLPPVFLGDWKTKKDSEGKTYPTSNDDYFDKVIRGPEADRIKKAQADAEEAKKEAARRQREEAWADIANDKRSFRCGPNDPRILRLPADWPIEWPEYESIFHMTKKVSDIVGDISFWERSNSVSVGALTNEELEKLAKDQTVCVAVMAHIFRDYAALFDEFCSLSDKSEKATARIRELTNELASYTGGRTIN